ncbi:MAG: polyhydroxyalkanoate depolymerase [Verrucomicrobia bacterium]|nr:polyhydroxyalkanoate depolymerase [Verrucomicrobiota bacterium]
MRLCAIAALGWLGLGGLVVGDPIVEDGLAERLRVAGENAGEIRGFVEAAREEHGAFGEKAAVALVEGMPAGDLQGLTKAYLVENLNLALKAREEFPWAKEVPEEVFLNDVLPYASLDETREGWRPEFYEKAGAMVKECQTATEAVQALNREFFKQYGVHYNKGRKRPNQSPLESKELGMATCTGLSIILVDACRAVGVPARVAGTPLWANKRGNHTWVEIYDGGEWHFTGADEYKAQGLNRAWFTRDASKAIAEDWRHAIWATSWKKEAAHFPMVWDLENKSVGGVNVTGRYAQAVEKVAEELVPVHVRVFDKAGGERMVVEVELLGADAAVRRTVTTKAGTADLNDMATIEVAKGREFQVRLRHGEEVKTATGTAEGEMTWDLSWAGLEKEAGLPEAREWLALLPEERHLSVPERELTKEEAAAVTRLVIAKLKEEEREARKEELARRDATADGSIQFGVVKAAGKEMKVLERSFGDAPEGGHSLWISMHGGGGAPAEVNDGQWKNQIMLYEPAEGIYVAPRAPTDSWRLWHEGHMDDLIDRTIENYVIGRGVNPDRVYLMGYSAGGDGVYQLAPRMADRFAAASMMAGHPNGASPLGLRNLPFMIWMGANDGAYKRNKVAADWGKKLDVLEQEDAGGYVHETHLVEGKGHWMDREDRAAVPWMAKYVRQAWPKKVVWYQSGRTHERFYWLAVEEEAAKRGATVRGEVEGQKISLQAEGVGRMTLRLSDALVDLDGEVVVELNGAEVFRGKVPRTTGAIYGSLLERFDVGTVATGSLVIGG